MQSIKEHNLKANHNFRLVRKCEGFSVCNLSKNTIWKQITTRVTFIERSVTLYAIYQRTQSESKSQQLGMDTAGTTSVCNLSKNTIWKQITTIMAYSPRIQYLYAIYQRTQSESKSQLWLLLPISIYSVCNLSKNTIWKQITTINNVLCVRQFLYAIYQRTQSESKSQRISV